MRDRSSTVNAFFLIVLTSLLLWVLYLVLRPLLKTLLLAAVLAILSDRLYRRAVRLFKGRDNLAALATCGAITLIILIPIVILLALLTVESIALYGEVSSFLQQGGMQNILSQPGIVSLQETVEKYFTLLGGGRIDIKAKLAQQLQALSGFFIATGQKLAGNVASTVGLFFILIFSLYYFLLEGKKLVRYIVNVLPLPESGSRRLLARFEDVTHAAFLGTFGVAAAQGALGGIALAIVGYQGIFWGLIMAFTSLLPLVGSAIVWVPAGFILMVEGRILAGVFVLAWGIMVISLADNILRPYLMQGRSGLHPLLILVSVLGGIQQFGMLGIVFGPLAASLGLTLLDMFGEEFGAGRIASEEDSAGRPGSQPTG